ncbi:uncharacterized protein LOC127878207 [Dreissena polymorpha]|uniref:uncharacterized protein LOC127878207 n=1 Tax=Dreissena polymorpha TaxID=45954 RepID=UPI0022643707|nr:uncharacterized protein LOC127878207 [Dreissena polymorpha]
MVTSFTTHSQDADHLAIEVMKVREEIKSSVANNRGNPGQLLSDNLSKYPVGVRVAAGKPDPLKRAIKRIQRENTSPEPANVTEIPEIPAECTTTGGMDNIPFLLYDNYEPDQENENIIVIFGTELGLKHLCDSDRWYMDGTFGTAPKRFKQLFIIRAAVSDVYATCVYAFLPNKQQSAYENVFGAVMDACDRYELTPNPTSVSCYFEISIHRAINTMLGPQISIQGCFYHVTQSTWRKLQSDGLSVLYKEDESIKHFCGMIDGLAFLPTDCVQEGMRYLRSVVPEELSEILEYFDTYVSGPYQSTRGSRGVIKVTRTNNPRYPVDMWNVNEATLNDEVRTNNICESWNNGFAYLVGQKNPSLWYCLSSIQKDQINVLTELERLRQVDQVKKRVRREVKQYQQKLKSLCQQFSKGKTTVSAFLQALGHLIRFKYWCQCKF